jgi:hypothetical protein
MTFEEFFKKKRIDLDALEKGNPALFSEFKTHFNQMGEKSFDHTKKYWFNNLRKIYHLAAEIKTEKPKIENQLAEQTVTDSLTEQAADSHILSPEPQDKPGITKTIGEINKAIPASPKPGFTPRFKPGVTKPAETPAEEKKAEEAPAPTAPKPGFTPRFKPGVTKPAEAAPAEEKKEEVAPPVEDKPKIGFTPRFKAGVTKPAEEEKTAEEPPAPAAPKLGFKPKFKPTTPPESEGE